MIKITIEKTKTEEYRVNQNYITKSTPTEIIEDNQDSYGGRTNRKVKCVEEYEVRQETRTRDTTIKLFEQVIENDDLFDLVRVISAVNEEPWTVEREAAE